MLLVRQAAAAASTKLLLFYGFPFISFRSWACSVYVVVLFRLDGHISGAGTTCFLNGYLLLLLRSIWFFVSLVFLSANASDLLLTAFVCHTCRI